jgi:PadR family transcriptional regulator PadR
LPESIQTQLRKGVLELCVLTLLSRADAYGYEIASRLMQEVGMGEGTIYPLMRRLQDDGLVTTYLVEVPGSPPRKYYRLTEAGRNTLKAQRGEWKNFMAAVEKMLGEEP